MSLPATQLLNQFTGRVMAGLNSGWTASELREQTLNWVNQFARHASLNEHKGAVALLAGNCPDWIAIDMACNISQCALVPLPDFFTDEQLQHLVDEAQVALLITDNTHRAKALGFSTLDKSPSGALQLMHRTLPSNCTALPEGVDKITFTSGTTGNPKGVCLSLEQQLHVASALKEASAGLTINTHLCLLPFSVLLENIAGVYAPMLSGANIVCPGPQETGLHGASYFDAAQCLNTISKYKAESIILLPQMLFALLQATYPGDPRTTSLKLIAVGGGKVPSTLLSLAQAMSLPIYEGYGLSECASVVCLNTVTHQRANTVGKPLPGVEVRVDTDGEIWVKGRGFTGYLHDLKAGLGNTVKQGEWLPTGDLGELSNDGFVSIQGRKKNLIITGFGRNISPEWPESVLLASGQFLQAAVFGEGQCHLTAVLVPRAPMSELQIQNTLRGVNQQLPDYAQIHQHVVAREPFSFENGLTTANGRIRREAIGSRYITPLLQPLGEAL